MIIMAVEAVTSVANSKQNIIGYFGVALDLSSHSAVWDQESPFIPQEVPKAQTMYGILLDFIPSKKQSGPSVARVLFRYSTG